MTECIKHVESSASFRSHLRSSGEASKLTDVEVSPGCRLYPTRKMQVGRGEAQKTSPHVLSGADSTMNLSNRSQPANPSHTTSLSIPGRFTPPSQRIPVLLQLLQRGYGPSRLMGASDETIEVTRFQTEKSLTV